MAKLEIVLSGPVHTAQPGTAMVRIEGAPAGGSVDVTLVQKQGRAPFWGPESQQVKADATGAALATFRVSFHGPTPNATLLASATDVDATYYESDAHSVAVLP
jgi:hypothetical protein